MQMSLYDAMEKFTLVKMVMGEIETENDKYIKEHYEDIYTLLEEYSEILLHAKVTV